MQTNLIGDSKGKRILGSLGHGLEENAEMKFK
jgi:hypothetical protein